jgi:hypothetical protein
VVTGGLALLGTTLTSCLQVWETIGLGVEEPSGATAQPSGPARAGTVTGAVFTAVILWFMLVAAAATLGRHHHAAASAQDAARALRPPYDHPATGPRTGRDWHRRGAATTPARRQDRRAQQYRQRQDISVRGQGLDARRLAAVRQTPAAHGGAEAGAVTNVEFLRDDQQRLPDRLLGADAEQPLSCAVP